MANSSIYDGSQLTADAYRAERGSSFALSSTVSAANGGGLAQWIIQSSSKDVIVSSRVITTNGSELTYLAYAFPTVTDFRTAVPIVNLNVAKPKPTTLKAWHTPTVSAKGAALVPSYIPGGEGQGNRTVGNIYANTAVNILPKNTTVLVEVENNGSVNPANIELYVLFSELTNPAPFQG